QLPDGLNLSSMTGEISGTPTAIGTFDFTIRVDDNQGVYNEKVLILTIDEKKTRYEENDPALVYQGSWAFSADGSASGGGYNYSSDTGTPGRVTLTFSGSEVRWISDVWGDLGIANVYLDGNLDATVDLYGNANLYQQVVYTKKGISPGVHALTLEVTGMKNSKSAGKVIDLDALEVIP
ncbi:MAG: putative Ig domain-containing protein, partial [Nitrospirae bacterium]|nr:putative Ig domain-containing protein [Nitrospirota bacterium]